MPINAYKLEVSLSGGYTTINRVDFSEVTIENKRVENEMYNRLSISGSFLIFGSDYDAIIGEIPLLTNKANLKCRLSQNNVVQLEFWASWRERIDTDSKILELSYVETIDNYKELLQSLEIKQNILNTETKGDTLRVSNSLPKLFFYTTNVTASGLYLTGADVDNIYARQERFVNNQIVKRVYIDNGWTDLGDGRVAKTWVGDYPTGTYVFYDPTLLLTINDQVNLDGTLSDNYLSYGTYLTDTIPAPGSSDPVESVVLVNETAYNIKNYDYIQFRRFYEVVEDMIIAADSSVSLDKTGTVTDSFYAFKKDSELSDIMILTLSDFLLQDNAVKSDFATKSELSLNQVFDFFKEVFNIYYHIDSSKVLRFVWHPDSVSRTASAKAIHNTTNFKGINWAFANNSYSFDKTNEFQRIIRTSPSQNIDFIGTDIILSDVIGETKQITLETFITDFQSIYQFPDKFSNTTNQFVLIDAVADNTWEVVDTVAQISGIVIPNAALSLANIDYNFAAKLPAGEVIINGDVYVPDAEQRDVSRVQNAIMIPVSNIANEFDFAEYVKTGLSDDCILESITQKDGDFAEIIVKTRDNLE